MSRDLLLLMMVPWMDKSLVKLQQQRQNTKSQNNEFLF